MRQAFAALKSQFIAHHDMLEAKERELVRQDGKVGSGLCPACMLLQQPSYALFTLMATPACCAVATCMCTVLSTGMQSLSVSDTQRSHRICRSWRKGSRKVFEKRCFCSLLM